MISVQRWHPFEKYGGSITRLGYCLATCFFKKILFIEVNGRPLDSQILP